MAEYEARGSARIVLPGWVVVGLVPLIGCLLVVPLAFLSDAWWAWFLGLLGLAVGIAGLTFRRRR